MASDNVQQLNQGMNQYQEKKIFGVDLSFFENDSKLMRKVINSIDITGSEEINLIEIIDSIDFQLKDNPVAMQSYLDKLFLIFRNLESKKIVHRKNKKSDERYIFHPSFLIPCGDLRTINDFNSEAEKYKSSLKVGIISLLVKSKVGDVLCANVILESSNLPFIQHPLIAEKCKKHIVAILATFFRNNTLSSDLTGDNLFKSKYFRTKTPLSSHFIRHYKN